MKCFYLSFVNHDGFAGACVIEEAAIVTSWQLRINPGGEVLLWAMPDSVRYLFPLGRLLTRAELEQYGLTMPVGEDCQRFTM